MCLLTTYGTRDLWWERCHLGPSGIVGRRWCHLESPRLGVGNHRALSSTYLPRHFLDWPNVNTKIKKKQVRCANDVNILYRMAIYLTCRPLSVESWHYRFVTLFPIWLTQTQSPCSFLLRYCYFRSQMTPVKKKQGLAGIISFDY